MTDSRPTVVVYGATGYTGRLVVAELAARGVPMVLAGRNAERLAATAAEVPDAAIEVVEAPLDDHLALQDAAARGPVLINCAGPFARTGGPVLRAAIAAGTHYLDSTGEQDWIHHVLSDIDGDLAEASVAAIPGMGFDYVPGDALCHLVGAPAAPLVRLDVAYHLEGFGMTRGTQRSALEMLDGRDVVFEQGDWYAGGSQPLRSSVVFPEPVGRQAVGRYPAGEVVMVPRHLPVHTISARISTVSIVPRPLSSVLPYVQPVIERLMRTPVKGLTDRLIDRLPEGPPESERRDARWMIAVTATGRDGEVARGVVQGTDVYGLTARMLADGALAMADPSFTGVGALTPAQAFDPGPLLDGLADFGVTYTVEEPVAPVLDYDPETDFGQIAGFDR